jgi:quinol monooxygenase YgiN
MYVFIVEIRASPLQMASLDRLLDETVAEVARREPGTVAYVVHRDPLDPMVRIIYECYEDEHAFLNHENAAHVQRFLDEREDYLSCPPTVTRLSTTTGSVQGSVRTRTT